MIADALGNPLAFGLTGAQQADVAQAEPLLEAIDPPAAVIADKGCDADAFVVAIERINARAIIPPRRNRCTARAWDRHRFRLAI